MNKETTAIEFLILCHLQRFSSPPPYIPLPFDSLSSLFSLLKATSLILIRFKIIILPQSSQMAIPETITSLPPQLRLRLFTGAAIAGALLSVLAVGPSFSDVISYFWPLLLSTAFFLVAVALVMWLSPMPASGESATGEEILEFVTRRPPGISPEQEL